MKDYKLTAERMADFRAHLLHEERSSGTIEKYMRDVRLLFVWMDGRAVTRDLISQWKESLLSGSRMPVTVNSMLAAVNSFFRFAGWEACRIKYLRIQRSVFRSQGRDLTRMDYDRLVNMARIRGNERLALLMETICATGIRVSEVKYVTVEAAESGRAEISMKGKIRTILIPSKLRSKLLKYAKKKKTVSGELFLSGNGKSLSRKQIWAEMKRLCKYADVEYSKVFPHNLRHLFATSFYGVCKDIVRLADVLGHSSIDTTRIYLMTTGAEYARQLDRLGLVS